MPRVFEYLDSATLYVDLERYEIPWTHLDSLANPEQIISFDRDPAFFVDRPPQWPLQVNFVHPRDSTPFDRNVSCVSNAISYVCQLLLILRDAMNVTLLSLHDPRPYKPPTGKNKDHPAAKYTMYRRP